MANIQQYEDFVSDAVQVVEFKLVRDRADVENPLLIFHPAMAHQIFGESESIFGYKGLRISIFYTAGPLHIYLGVEYTTKVDEISNGDIKADNVVTAIAKKLPDGCYFINLDEFLKTLDKADKFHPFGEKLGEHTCLSEETGNQRLFEFYVCDYKVPAFLKYFSRLETFVLWFVDAACYIDVDDTQWKYFICYEKYKNDNGEYQYASVGYTTVYNYYAYPQNIRPRISQMLVLPPFQNLGIATNMLQYIYKFYQSQKNVIDITVEDPSDDFQRMRLYVDANLCKDLKSFSPDEIKKGFNKEMEREAREAFKINARQVRKVYEILRLLHTNINDKADYKNYRLAIKARLNSTYYKQLADLKKMQKANVDIDLKLMGLPSAETRLVQLQEEYEQLEDSYMNIIQKLR